MLETNRINLSETRHYPPTLLDYLAQKQALAPFYHRFPSPENYYKQALERKNTFPAVNRKKLVEVFTEQYASLPLLKKTEGQITLLANENTYTITTGHQLNLLTGPLYVVLKLQTTINLAKKLKKNFPEFNFVPVYWMATEDHDFEEINHLYLFGKKYTWENGQKGAVGEFKTTELAEFLQTLPDLPPGFMEAYSAGKTLAEATASFVHSLFGDQGLLVLNPNNTQLKQLFRPVMEAELINEVSASIIKQTSEKLSQAGYKTQVNSREINLFYLGHQLRERIVKEENIWRVLNTDLSFSEPEILDELEKHPEKFSPNVILRPLYQETIMPNLGYVGGPAEIGYWMQLMPLFQHFNIPFPILQPRHFAAIISKSLQSRMKKLQLKFQDLAQDETLLKQHILSKVQGPLQNTLYEEQTLAGIFQSLAGKAAEVDKSLTEFVLSEKAKAEKLLDGVIKRLKKAEEKKHETILNQALGLKQKLFPDQGLQERTDNFLNFYVNNPGILDCLSTLDPFDFRFNILEEREESN